MRQRATLVPLIASLAIACGGPTPSAGPTASPALRTFAPTLAPSASEPAAPTAGPTEAATCLSAPQLPCLLPPGEFSTSFEPSLRFTLREAWMLLIDLPFVTFMIHEAGAEAGLSISTDVSIEADGPIVNPSPRAFVDYLEGLGGLDLLDRAEVDVAGRPAIRLDVRATRDFQALFRNGPAEADTVYELLQGQPARIWVLREGGQTVLVVIEPGPGGDLEPSLAVAEPVVDSITFN